MSIDVLETPSTGAGDDYCTGHDPIPVGWAVKSTHWCDICNQPYCDRL